jgi:hypothetical protein
LPLLKIFDSEFLSFLLLHFQEKLGIKISNTFLTINRNDLLFILKEYLLKEFRNFVISDIFRQSSNPFEIFNNFVFPYLKPKRTHFDFEYYVDRLYDSKFNFSKVWYLNFLFSTNKIGLFMNDLAFGEFNFAFRDFYLFQKDNFDPLYFKGRGNFFYEYEPLNYLFERDLSKVKFFSDGVYKKKKLFGILDNKFKKSILKNYNAHEVIGKQVEGFFLKIFDEFFKKDSSLYSDFKKKSSVFLKNSKKFNFKESLDFSKDLSFFLDDLIAFNTSKIKANLIKGFEEFSPKTVKNKYFFNQKSFDKLRRFVKLYKYDLDFFFSGFYESAFFKILEKALDLVQLDAQFDKEMHSDLFKFYFNQNSFLKSIFFSGKLHNFEFLGRSYTIFNIFSRLLSQYFIYVNPDKVKVPKISDLIFFFSKFPKFNYLFGKDSNGNFIIHTFGLSSFFNFGPNDIFSKLREEHFVYGYFPVIKTMDISKDYTLFNSLFHLFFERYNPLKRISFDHNVFAFFFGFINHLNISYYKKMNDFISLDVFYPR